MNTMTILLGATFALLLAAVVLSFQNMKEGVRNAPPDELARLRTQIDELKLEQEKIRLERELHNVVPAQETIIPVPDVEKLKAELAAKEAEIAALSGEKQLAEKKADTFRDEAGLIGQRDLEKGDQELRRARMIRDALLIASIIEYHKSPESGDFAVVEIAMPEHVQVGTILAIRRNTGILGRMTITEITPEGAIGSLMPGFGPIEPQAGDELIIPPQV